MPDPTLKNVFEAILKYGHDEDFAPKFNTGDQKRVETEFNWDQKPRNLVAIDPVSARVLWRKDNALIAPLGHSPRSRGIWRRAQPAAPSAAKRLARYSACSGLAEAGRGPPFPRACRSAKSRCSGSSRADSPTRSRRNPTIAHTEREHHVRSRTT